MTKYNAKIDGGEDSNAARAGRVDDFVAEYDRLFNAEEGDMQTTVTDILTDLRHYCALAGLDFERAATMSESHFDAERDEEASAKCRECGEPSTGGEGWDGLCGNCADKAERDCEAEGHVYMERAPGVCECGKPRSAHND